MPVEEQDCKWTSKPHSVCEERSVGSKVITREEGRGRRERERGKADRGE